MGIKKQLALAVTIRVAPHDVPAFLEALRPVWKACCEEPECVFFDIFQDPAVPGSFRFTEIWNEDRQWFESKQMTKAYYEPYTEITAPMWLEERKIEFFEREPGWSAFKEGYLAGGTKVE